MMLPGLLTIRLTLAHSPATTLVERAIWSSAAPDRSSSTDRRAAPSSSASRISTRRGRPARGRGWGPGPSRAAAGAAAPARPRARSSRDGRAARIDQHASRASPSRSTVRIDAPVGPPSPRRGGARTRPPGARPAGRDRRSDRGGRRGRRRPILRVPGAAIRGYRQAPGAAT